MNKKIYRYIGIGVICLLIILSLANPSPKQFKDFIGDPSFERYSMIYKRTSNWLIYSTYEFSYSSAIVEDYRSEEIVNTLDKLTGTYTGFFLNFYRK